MKGGENGWEKQKSGPEGPEEASKGEGTPEGASVPGFYAGKREAVSLADEESELPTVGGRTACVAGRSEDSAAAADKEMTLRRDVTPKERGPINRRLGVVLLVGPNIFMEKHFEKLKKRAKEFPNSPGVYIWRDKNKKPLYVGRAGSLKKRVQSYFRTKDPRIGEMVESAKSITFDVTETLLEAIVLEANLIKKYWPKYNVRDKDNKSFIYLVITAEEFPRPLVVRGRELEKYDSGKIKAKAIFGPYQSYWLLKKSLEIIRRIFPFSYCKPPGLSLRPTSRNPGNNSGSRVPPEGRAGKPGMTTNQLRAETATRISQSDVWAGKPCFHYQIGLCPGVCVGEVDKKEYRKNIRNIVMFFRGEKKRLVNGLKKEGSTDQVKALRQVNDVALLADSDVMVRQTADLSNRRIEGYDISHLSGKEPVGAMVVFENGERDNSQYRLFKIRGASRTRSTANSTMMHHSSKERADGRNYDDLKMLQEVVSRRMNHKEWPSPDIVFVDGGLNQARAVNRVLLENNLHVPVVGLSKAGKHAGSAYSADKLVILNAKKTGKELIIGSKKLFQEVRNEAHRFAIGFQKKRRGGPKK